MPVYTLRFNRGGLFFLINNVIDFLEMAETNDFTFTIRMENCLYEDPSKKGPVWNYYFEDIFDVDQTKAYPVYEYKQFRRDHLTAPRVRNGRMEPLLLPRDRGLAGHYIEKYLQLKQHIQRIINEFKGAHFSQPVFGLHLRGPGRLHGGMRVFLKKLELKDGVPYQIYFEHVDRLLEKNPHAKILVCSDSSRVIRECSKAYGDKIICYNAIRTDFGEMHATGATDTAPDFFRYKLGEDVLVEAYLLAHTDYFVHGNSNISNFVLCKNPALEHKYVFEDIKVNWRLRHVKTDVMRSIRSMKKMIKRILINRN